MVLIFGFDGFKFLHSGAVASNVSFERITDFAVPLIGIELALLQLGLGDWECVFVGEGGFYAAAKAATDKGTPVIGRVRMR